MQAEIRALTGADAEAFRCLRLEALRRHPEAFGAAAEEAETLDLAGFVALMPKRPPDAIFGAVADGSLVGMVGFLAQRRLKQRHKGMIWGVYVRPEARGHGVAHRLMQRAIAEARAAGLERLLLTVALGNTAARTLYDRLGFLPYGLERAALRLPDGQVIDEELRALDLHA